MNITPARFLIASFITLFAVPATANEITVDIEGTFTDEGEVSGGFFEGSFSYDSDTPDGNPNVLNQGLFELSDFNITVFDDQSQLVDQLTDENSTGAIALTAPPTVDEATLYEFQTTADDFFSTGALNLDFDFPAGGDPNTAPEALPGEFIDGQFNFGGAFGEQDVSTVSLAQSGQTVSTNEQSTGLGLCLMVMVLSVFRLGRQCSCQGKAIVE